MNSISRAFIVWLAALFLMTVVPLPGSVTAAPEQAFNVSYKSSSPNVNTWTGSVSDTFTTSQKKTYMISLSNNLDQADALSITIDYLDNWTLTLDGTNVTAPSLNKTYSIGARGTIDLLLYLQAPSSSEDADYTLTYTIVSNSTAYTHTENIQITFKGRRLTTQFPSELNVPMLGHITTTCTVSNADTAVNHTAHFSVSGDIQTGSSSNPEKWVIELPPDTSIPPGGSSDLPITIYSPSTESAATITVFILKITDVESDLDEDIQVKLNPISGLNITVISNPDVLTLSAGETGDATITVKNNGTGSGILSILPFSQPHGWKTEFYKDSTQILQFNIGAKSTVILKAKVIMPDNPTGGMHDLVFNLSSSSATYQFTIKVDVPQIFGLNITAKGTEDEFTVHPGKSRIKLTVDNMGNGADDIEFSIISTSPGLSVSFTDEADNGILKSQTVKKAIYTMQPGSGAIYLDVTVSTAAAAGVLNFTIYGISKLDTSGKSFSTRVVSLINEKSDLKIVGDIKLSGHKVKEGSEFRIKFTILNNYNQSTKDFYVRLYVDGSDKPTDEKHVDVLDANRSISVELSWVASGVGTHLVKAVVEGKDIPPDTVATDSYSIEVEPAASNSLIPGPDVYTTLLSLLLGLGIAVIVLEVEKRRREHLMEKNNKK